MLSPARLAANAANAQLSTGPRTTEGKARSSQNARKHGLTSHDVFVAPEDQHEYEQLVASLSGELQPQGALEGSVFQQIVHAAWNLARIRRLEASLPTSQPDPLLDDALDKTLARLARYHARAERTFFRCLKELRALQTERVLRDSLLDRAAEVPVLASVRSFTKGTHRALGCKPDEHRVFKLKRPWRSHPAPDLPASSYLRGENDRSGAPVIDQFDAGFPEGPANVR